MTDKIRIGILVDQTSTLQQWQVDCLEMLKSHKEVEIVFVAAPKHTTSFDKSPKNNRLRKLWGKNSFWHLYWKYSKPSQIQDVKYDWSDINILTIQVTPDRNKTVVADKDLEVIKNQNPDILLRLGWGILAGEILEAATFGVWSFHHNDPHVYRGGPPAFWEIYYRQSVQGAVLQKLNEKLDGGFILAEAHIRTNKHSLSESYNEIVNTSPFLLQQAIGKVKYGKVEGRRIDRKKGVFKTYPNNGQFLSALCTLVFQKLKFQHRKFWSDENWFLMESPYRAEYSITDIESHINSTSSIIKKSKKAFYADAFLLPDNTGVLAEKFDFKEQKGKIVFMDDAGKEKVILEHEKHSSYPYVFEHKERTYVAPEQHLSGRQTIYRWNSEKQVLEDPQHINIEACIDPTFLYHENRWWLFCTHAPHSNSALYIYYADQLLGEYKPHALNPVKIDVKSARPAGQFLKINNELYRPTQKNDAFYGSGIRWVKIKTLSSDIFEEEQVRDFTPHNFKLLGIHTFSYNDNRIVMDGKTKNAAF